MADFDALWNYDDPAGTEAAFQKVLQEDGGSMAEPRRAELLSQIARALGLQRRFEEANEVLDRAMVFAGEDPLALSRCFLERGRALNSFGQRDAARPYFERALSKAEEASALDPREGESSMDPKDRRADFYVVDALHMLAIVALPGEQMAWHERAIARAEASPNALTRIWLGSLLNNLGWTLHDAGRLDEALAVFERALAFRREQGKEGPVRIAQWTVARCLRSLGRYDEAIATQRFLSQTMAQAQAPDGFVEEEIAENLLALGRDSEAAPHFARALELLSQDTWLSSNEPERIERLRRFAKQA